MPDDLAEVADQALRESRRELALRRQSQAQRSNAAERVRVRMRLAYARQLRLTLEDGTDGGGC